MHLPFTGRAIAAMVYLALAGSVAAMWGALALGERLDGPTVAGSVLVLAGSAVVIRLTSLAAARRTA